MSDEKIWSGTRRRRKPRDVEVEPEIRSQRVALLEAIKASQEEPEE